MAAETIVKLFQRWTCVISVNWWQPEIRSATLLLPSLEYEITLSKQKYRITCSNRRQQLLRFCYWEADGIPWGASCARDSVSKPQPQPLTELRRFRYCFTLMTIVYQFLTQRSVCDSNMWSAKSPHLVPPTILSEDHLLRHDLLPALGHMAEVFFYN